MPRSRSPWLKSVLYRDEAKARDARFPLSVPSFFSRVLPHSLFGRRSRSRAKRFQKSFARFSAARTDRIKERLRPSSTRNHVAPGVYLESQSPNAYQSFASSPPSSSPRIVEENLKIKNLVSSVAFAPLSFNSLRIFLLFSPLNASHRNTSSVRKILRKHSDYTFRFSHWKINCKEARIDRVSRHFQPSIDAIVHYITCIS